MTMLNNIGHWPTQRWPWLLLLASALSLETVALFFQYGMGLEPCIMCVYQRLAVLGIAVATLPALISIRFRLISQIAWIAIAAWGLAIAYEHVQMQNPDNFMLLLGCDIVPNFPTWFAIHEWFPAIFEPRGTCGDIDWSWLGFSMPQWMVVVFSIYLALGILITVNRWRQTGRL